MKLSTRESERTVKNGDAKVEKVQVKCAADSESRYGCS